VFYSDVPFALLQLAHAHLIDAGQTDSIDLNDPAWTCSLSASSRVFALRPFWVDEPLSDKDLIKRLALLAQAPQCKPVMLQEPEEKEKDQTQKQSTVTEECKAIEPQPIFYTDAEKRYLVYRTLHEMLVDRGYEIIADSLPILTQAQFLSLTKHQQVNDALTIFGRHKQTGFYLATKFTEASLKHRILDRFQETMMRFQNPCWIVVTCVSIKEPVIEQQKTCVWLIYFSIQIRQNILARYPTVYIDAFTQDELLFNVTRHKWQPRFVRLDDTKRRMVEQYYGVTNPSQQWPTMHHDDPIARYFGFRAASGGHPAGADGPARGEQSSQPVGADGPARGEQSSQPVGADRPARGEQSSQPGDLIQIQRFSLHAGHVLIYRYVMHHFEKKVVTKPKKPWEIKDMALRAQLRERKGREEKQKKMARMQNKTTVSFEWDDFHEPVNVTHLFASDVHRAMEQDEEKKARATSPSVVPSAVPSAVSNPEEFIDDFGVEGDSASPTQTSWAKGTLQQKDKHDVSETARALSLLESTETEKRVDTEQKTQPVPKSTLVSICGAGSGETQPSDETEQKQQDLDEEEDESDETEEEEEQHEEVESDSEDNKMLAQDLHEWQELEEQLQDEDGSDGDEEEEEEEELEDEQDVDSDVD
jgi:DNA-directed RNA polymerase subunit H (RpoH/RPB5)